VRLKNSNAPRWTPKKYRIHGDKINARIGGSGRSGIFFRRISWCLSPASGCRAARCVLPDEFPGPALPPLPPFPLFEINDLLEKKAAPGRSQTVPSVWDV
jgi:hypothetical protein